MTTKPTLRAPVEKPEGYQRDDYRALLADLKAGKITHFRQVLQINAMPNDRYEINSENPSLTVVNLLLLCQIVPLRGSVLRYLAKR